MGGANYPNGGNGTGTMYFQYGRKDPIFGNTSTGFEKFSTYPYNDIIKDSPDPVASLLFAVLSNIYYYSKRNSDRPVITSDTALLKISTADGGEGLLQGLKAYDATDGDITEKIMVASVSHFIAENTANVKYVVFDAHNNSATLTRKVEYTDYKAPVFKLLKSPVYTKGDRFDLSGTPDIENFNWLMLIPLLTLIFTCCAICSRKTCQKSNTETAVSCWIPRYGSK